MSISHSQYEHELHYENKITPNDRVSIHVYTKTGLSEQYIRPIVNNINTTTAALNRPEGTGILVTQDGTVRLPLINSIKIAGYTEDQASKVLINEYKKYIKNPYVTVKITNQRIIVIGKVTQPGVVPIVNGTMNLFEVIARSGGLKPLADRRDIKIIRGDLRSPEIRKIDLTSADAIRNSSLLLQPNDIVYVQARQMSGFNKAFKETVPFFSMISSMLEPFVQWTTIQGDSILY